jgi:hypothetical protein
LERNKPIKGKTYIATRALIETTDFGKFRRELLGGLAQKSSLHRRVLTTLAEYTVIPPPPPPLFFAEDPLTTWKEPLFWR